ncbi:MAG: glutamate synthase subunit beta [Lachnospiraceae bacterium]|nr:glutamate synthase subunit beta [Lachnospiraceae bacterium]
MGKPAGFLEYKRVENASLEPRERVTNYREFHRALTAAARKEQGARCMNCGVPFCQSDYGCPLHNLIPEWNDQVYTGNLGHALSRLLKTNNFPEFTGRVCPALCENACVCGIHDDPVTVRENELFIIENAWNEGLMLPMAPAARSGRKVAVAGSGPAGLAAADELNRRGHLVTVYERDDRPGGLLMYGIPGMKLDKSIVLRRIEKMKAEGIRFICGTEVGRDISGISLRNEYDAVILSCGARKARKLAADALRPRGVVDALDYLTASAKSLLSGGTNTLSAEGKCVIVVGNGDTASDCVATALRQGAAHLIQLVRKPKKEAAGRCWPHTAWRNREDYASEEAAAVFGHDIRMYESEIREYLPDEKGCLKGVIISSAGEKKEIEADMVIVAAGFAGAEESSVKSFGLELDAKGRLGDDGCRTADEKVFACGDMRRGASLVVWAIAEGRTCARAVDRYLEGYTNL